MKICGNAEIRLQEIYQEAIQDDQFWIDESLLALQSIANFDSTERPTLHFFYMNNRKNGAGLCLKRLLENSKLFNKNKPTLYMVSNFT